MRLRELTTDIRKPIDEDGIGSSIMKGLGWLGRGLMSGPAAAAQVALTPSSTSAWDTTDAPAMLYNKLRADGQSDADADRSARELKKRIQSGDASSVETYKKIMGDGPLPWDLQDLNNNIQQKVATGNGRGDGNAELAQRRANAGAPGAETPPPATANTPVPDIIVRPKIGDAPTAPPAPKVSNVTKVPKKPASAPNSKIPSEIKTLPNVVKDAGAAQALAQSTPQTTTQWADGISKATGGALGASTVSGIANTAMKYALPAAAVVALLYGGKKLIDYLNKDKKKEGVNEVATTGATAAADGAALANPPIARSKKKPKKQKPGENALDNTTTGLFGQPLKR